MRRRLSALLLGALLGTAPAAAQPGVSARFQRLGLDDGLSQSSVLAVRQDRRGFLWLGTQDGLNRYDGTGFRVWRHEPFGADGLPTSYVQTLHEDARGALWVGTWGGGLARLRPDEAGFDAFRHRPGAAASLPDDVVTAVRDAPGGGLWVGTAKGLARFDPASGRATPAPPPLDAAFVWSVAEGAGGALWVGTLDDGVYRLEAGGGVTRFGHAPGDARSLASEANAVVHRAADGALWAGTADGLHRWAGGGFERVPLPGCGRFIHALADGPKGALWVGTDEGLCRVQAGAVRAFRHNPTDPHSLPKDIVRSLAWDRGGVLWVGTDGGGVARYTGAQAAFGHYRPDPLDPGSLAHPYVWALHEDARGVWVGTDGGGLDRLDPATGRFAHHRHDPADPASIAADVVLSLAPSRRGGLWVGLFNAGLDYHDPATGRFRHYPFHKREDGADPAGPGGSVVSALFEDADGALWAGTWGGGLSRLDPGTERFEHLRYDPDDPGGLPNDAVTTVRPARDGGLWVGTYGGGLAHLDRRTRRFTPLAERLSHTTVYGVWEAPDRTVWVATAGGGLNRLDRAGGGWADTARVYTTRDGLPHNIVYALLPDAAGGLWCATNAGLARLDLATETFRTYTPADGLQSREFNAGAAHRAPDGTLLFGGVNGFNRFRPSRLAAAARPPPPVAVTGLRLFDRPVPLPERLDAGGTLVLDHADNFVTFELAALDFADPARNRLRYRLEGYDAGWRETDGARPRASYTDLPGGRYTFRVAAALPGEAWGPALALPVHVVPPFWATAGFRLGVAGVLLLGLAAAAVAWHRRRLARLEAEQRAADRRREAERAAARRLAEGREAERVRIARELHDGPLQDLYGARYQLEALVAALDGPRGDGQPPADGPPPAGGPADQARDRAEGVHALLGDVSGQLRALCQALRPPALGPFGLAGALRSYAGALAEEHPAVRFEVDGEQDGQRLPERVRVALFRVAQEAVRNALRHAAPRHVRVTLRLRPEAVDLEVEDDGCGFVVPEPLVELARRDHLGLVGASERAEAVGGRLAVESRPGAGTRVRASVPLAPVLP